MKMKTIQCVVIILFLYFLYKSNKGMSKFGASKTAKKSPGPASSCNSPLLDSSDKALINQIAINQKGTWNPPSGYTTDGLWWSSDCKIYFLGNIQYKQGFIKPGMKPFLGKFAKDSINQIAKKHGGTWNPNVGWDGTKLRLGYIQF